VAFTKSGAEDDESIFTIKKSAKTINYSVSRANGVPIIVTIEDDSKLGFIILNDV